MGTELTYDHFQPHSKGGSDAKDNIVYACHACNEFKGDYFGDTEETRLLHPLQDDLTLHVQEQPDGALKGLTTAGERYITTLQLNRPPLVLRRKQIQQETEIQQNLRAINNRVDVALKRVQRTTQRVRRHIKGKRG